MADVLYPLYNDLYPPSLCTRAIRVYVSMHDTWEVIPRERTCKFTNFDGVGGRRRDNRNGDSFLLLTSGIENPRERIFHRNIFQTRWNFVSIVIIVKFALQINYDKTCLTRYTNTDTLTYRFEFITSNLRIVVF